MSGVRVVQIGGSSGGFDRNKTLTLTNAQLLTLPTTPIVAIDAPGVNKAIIVNNVAMKLTWFADYGNINPNGDLTLRWNNNHSAVAPLTNAFGDLNAFLAPLAFLGVGDSMVAVLPTFVQVSGLTTTSTVVTPTPPATILNSPLILNSSNGGDFIGGNAANVLTVVIDYFIANFIN